MSETNEAAAAQSSSGNSTDPKTEIVNNETTTAPADATAAAGDGSGDNNVNSSSAESNAAASGSENTPLEPSAGGSDAGVVSSQLQVINWDEAMNQVGGDEEFLDEVLADLITEAQTGQDDLQACITGRDFDGVMKAAHRIKGSTSYLCCEVMKEISLTLQLAGHEGLSIAAGAPTEALWARVESLFEAFVKSFADLQEEIKKHKAAAGGEGEAGGTA